MPKTHPPETRQRAVALAEARGIPAAAKHFGITEATIERWMADAPAQSDLERAYDLAQGDLTAKLATGETRGIRDLAVVAGIMRDKIARYGKDKPEPEQWWGARLDAWIDATYAPGERELANRAHDQWIDDELHRLEAAIRNPADEALADDDGDLDEAMLRGSQAFLRGIPDLGAWIAAWEARDAAQRARHRLVTARADVLHTEGGLYYHEALQLAEEITE